MTGRHRHPATRPVAAAVGLVVALAVAVWLLALPSPEQDRPAASAPDGPRELADVRPGARVAEHRATLADGTPYTPLLFLKGGTSVGTAESPGGGEQRLVLVTGGEARQLHTLSADAQPGFNAVTTDGERIVWAETLPGTGDGADTTFWTADAAGRGVRKLTADTGDVVFFGSQYDLQIVDGRLYWVSQPQAPVTELRSMPLDGGEVTVKRLDAGYALARWPWAVTIGGTSPGPVKLRDLSTGRTVTAPSGSGEMATCGASWCRVIVMARGGVARLDVMRTDGSQRRRMAGRDATPAVFDVMLLDRYEALTTAARNGSARDHRLLLYDAKTGDTLVVSSAVGVVRGRDGFLWWSTGEAETRRWHVLDLRTL